MKARDGIIRLSASDLSNYLACSHLTQLDRKVATGSLKAPTWRDPSLATLQLRGEAHEKAYIDFLKHKGLTVVNLLDQPKEATLDTMAAGPDVIVQATVGDDNWIGRIDILRRIEIPSTLGDWSYEVEDTKLAQDTRTGTILQLCLYTDFVAALQGVQPLHMHVVKPGDGFPKETLRVDDFQAYYRAARQRLVETISSPVDPSTYPEPVSHCDICRWWKDCDTKRHNDDHLCLIAGIGSLHIGELQRQGISTLQAFAESTKPLKERPARGNIEAFGKFHNQARIQLKGRKADKLLYQLLTPEPGRGLSRLPKPSQGDLYFDIEANPFFDNGGIEYLLGLAFKDKGAFNYQASWALNRGVEKVVFESFIDFVMKRWRTYPEMFIYHYSPYEPGAIKRLAARHGTHEIEVDQLLRSERFIDLFAVIREGLIASVEHYSLKDMERFTPFKRQIELPLANAARRRVDSTLELNSEVAIPDDDRKAVEIYNRDDCLATAALHDWLEARRVELESTGQSIERPVTKSGEASENVEERYREIRALFDRLVQDLPDDRSSWTEEDQAKWLFAHMLDYFGREDRTAWWEYFRLHELDYEDLLDERKAIAGLSFESAVGTPGRSVVHRFRYPTQEVGIDEGDALIEVRGEKAGEVVAIDQINRTIDIKRKPSASTDLKHVHANNRVPPGALPISLLQLGRSIADNGMTSGAPYSACLDLLAKRSPRLRKSLPESDRDLQEEAISIAASLNESCLAIQGPPGTGKTHTGGSMIARLATSGKRIGVTAVSHKVIRNLLESAIKAANHLSKTVNIVHKVSEKSEQELEGIEEVTDNGKALEALDDGKVVGGTAWLWARDEAAQRLDYLFIDEAGQMSLAQALAATRAAKNVILLGDPQQLEQPQKGAHPEGADVAALTHLLDGHKTIPRNKGLFLDTTWRLNPTICAFTSELYYENRLRSREGLENQQLSGDSVFAGNGLFYVPVNHNGNQIKSLEEVESVAMIIDRLTKRGVTWTDRNGDEHQMQKDDILIVAPYNAQVAALRERLSAMRIGTVDRFQGQEAPVVIYSMTSSSHEDSPRGMGFLYSPNRFNVATSRAHCSVILVGSPRLFEPNCNSVDQMRWANSLCRYREMARTAELR